MSDQEASFPHRSVLLEECLQALAPHSSGRYLDCTAGAGGHAQAILLAGTPDAQLLALDLDPQAVALSRQRLLPFAERAHVVHGSYTDSQQYLQELGWDKVDGILMDLGVSSMQLDQPERGFSFQREGLLDMRFDSSQEYSAATLVNTLPEDELANILYQYGEERLSRRIARQIVLARPLQSTTELADVIRKAIGHSKEKQDPATRSFQAIRIAVNRELRNVQESIPRLIDILNPGGRIAIISFHSLEDRIVKQAFKLEARNCICPPEQMLCNCQHHASVKIITPHPILPGAEELQTNSRSRSAKLRVAQKLLPPGAINDD